eukprot:3889196-Rhodomonas_salina.1
MLAASSAARLFCWPLGVLQTSSAEIITPSESVTERRRSLFCDDDGTGDIGWFPSFTNSAEIRTTPKESLATDRRRGFWFSYTGAVDSNRSSTGSGVSAFLEPSMSARRCTSGGELCHDRIGERLCLLVSASVDVERSCAAIRFQLPVETLGCSRVGPAGLAVQYACWLAIDWPCPALRKADLTVSEQVEIWSVWDLSGSVAAAFCCPTWSEPVGVRAVRLAAQKDPVASLRDPCPRHQTAAHVRPQHPCHQLRVTAYDLAAAHSFLELHVPLEMKSSGPANPSTRLRRAALGPLWHERGGGLGGATLRSLCARRTWFGPQMGSIWTRLLILPVGRSATVCLHWRCFRLVAGIRVGPLNSCRDLYLRSS